MTIRLDSITLPAAASIGTNPLPALRDQRVDRDVRSSGTLTVEDCEHLGADAAQRVLPYPVQDRYTRQRTPTALTTVVLENELVRATFLADFGGRLVSLRELRHDRELLFANPVFQPANLAIRNAWFAGGAEWNIGHYGHTVHACEPLFFATVSEGDNQVLRMWEYERQKRVFWQVDFRLEGALLQAHVRVVNPHAEATPMYWWTNVAIPQDESTRVFSGTADVLIQEPDAQVAWLREQGLPVSAETVAAAPVFFGRGRLPWLSDGSATFDASYPTAYQRASEYFFQNPTTDPGPWEAASYADGHLFWERSTQPLRFRKMFCWGRHPGGQWWCDFLSEPGRGDYLEVQAGLAPTQLHGFTLPGRGELEFTQVFGGADSPEPALLAGDWADARRHVESLVDAALPAATLAATDEAARLTARQPVEPTAILHAGSPWGALEALRDPAMIPEGFVFPRLAGDASEAVVAPWAQLVEHGTLPDLADGELPPSYVTDPSWRPLMEAAAAAGSTLAKTHLGVLEWENLQPERAVECWREAADAGDILALRNLAQAARAQGDHGRANELMTQAYAAAGPALRPRLIVDHLEMLTAVGDYATAWRVYQELPDRDEAPERAHLLAGRAALDVGETVFVESLFEREWAGIREGDLILLDLWYRNEARQAASARGVPLTDALVAETMATSEPPRAIDSRMFRA